MTAALRAMARHHGTHAHTAEQRAAASDLLADLERAPRFRVECDRTCRSLEGGIHSEAAAVAAAIGAGFKDYHITRIA